VRLKKHLEIMDLENEKKSEEASVEQTAGNREGFQSTTQSNGYQGYRPGRSPRPRIHSQRPYNQDQRSSYNRNNDEGGFRPEGFGAGLQNSNSGSPQRSQQYGGGYDQQRGGGYGQQRGGYGQQRGGYQQRGGGYGQQRGGYGQQGGGYRPRYNNNNEDGDQQYGGGYGQQQYGGGYQQRGGGYGQQRGGYQQRGGGYGQQRGGYQQRGGGYGQQRGGYGQQRGGGYGQQRGGYGQQGGGYRQHTPDYDPNAKYSFKKRIEYNEEKFDPAEPIRLNKFLANAGVCSRREADEFIQAGVVSVNGTVVTELGTKVLRSDEVKFHDQAVTLEKKVYVLLNKPKDYVTTSDDPQQRKTVMDLVKNACPERIYPVGRLDRNTTGVLLLTNDGDLASKLTHPKFLKKKIYHVYLDKSVTAHDMQQIADGITLEDGEIKADDIQYADAMDKKQVGIEIHSGKNRIVRRIFESLGYKVTKLDRVQFAGLTKKNLRRGDWRYLTEEEVDRLRMGAYE
jgi:23S rRNA pseudouridine2605 synthase